MIFGIKKKKKIKLCLQISTFCDRFTCMFHFRNHRNHNIMIHLRHVIKTYAGFRLTCRLPHCRFDDDICSTAQAPLAAEG